MYYDWSFWARPDQLTPDGLWRIWLILAGRGWGKTRTGAEDIIAAAKRGITPMGIVAPIAADVRDVMVEGVSGILSVAPPDFRPEYQPSKQRLVFPNGVTVWTRSADNPERLRGLQSARLWLDELAAWRYPESFDMLVLGCRLGTKPQIVITTTPKPTPIIKRLVARSQGDKPDVRLTKGSTYENRANLADDFITDIERQYEGTRLGQQELYAEILGDNPAALWTREMIEAHRKSQAPRLKRVVVAIDPAVTANEESDETGIVVAGVGEDGHGYVLDDGTLRGRPAQWAKQALSLYAKHQADYLVAEVNNGGDMVESTIVRAAEDGQQTVRVKQVRASRGKATRADPISRLYEQGKIHHIGYFGRLEDQMCEWVPGEGASPDRVDALVWALTDLMLHRQGGTDTKVRLY
jgi:phage terminase large subunit-like protein